ncbi:hypothetical protein M406DRAFT_272002 [Cryphonectria parasitica EP155]|uniref:UBA domain-containing protein n=1 Tax=Cryphonectria parasitica (strain ATCC 38755 / EP155) TaxID=660469 RepID=A0A9P5CVJ6_CRYP1|nr:uncharacterized protein M406DRAFT_272002 [Cryphonectria parasitica EP155]KAF3770735.1 hypothetical protein M406DRAFT_272002 [Cryphonectria parasitica EP155]
MDDLAGMDWSTPASSTNNAQKKPPMNPSSAFGSFPSLQPTPSPFASGRNTPLSAANSGHASGGSGVKVPAVAASTAGKPSQDAFSNLVPMGSGKSSAKMSLAERQKQLEAEKLKKLQEKQKQHQAAYGDGQFWDTLGRGSTPTSVSRTASPLAHGAGPMLPSHNGKTESDDDLFAAFNKDTKVDNASHYPPPAQPASGRSTPGLDLSNPSAWSQPALSNSAHGDFNNDDDPFGLSQFQAKSRPDTRPAPAPIGADEEDDDLLGDLGRPVDEVRKKQEAQRQKAPQPEPEPGKAIEDSDSTSSDDEPEARPQGGNDPFDKAVAQMMDMGFSPEDSRRGLTESGAGLNVQAAVSYLLNDAHQKAKEKTQGRSSPAVHSERSTSRARNAGPAWMNEEHPNRHENRSPATGDVDFAKQAAAMGTNFLKTANKFWSAGQKKVQKAVAEFQEAPADPNQPKWMRSAQQDRTGESNRAQRAHDATDEAMMLDSGARPERQSRKNQPHHSEAQRTVSRDQSPALSPISNRSASAPRWQQDPKSRLNKQAIEEQSSQAYISPARRKKTTPQPPAEPKPQFTEEPDLFSTQAPPARSLPSRSAQPSPRPVTAAAQSPRKTPTPRPAPPTRKIPPLDPSALQTSTRHRVDGTAHFKRGDYASAHASYSASLSAVPSTHPLAIVILCNRALTALKTGEPRQAVADADAAIQLIGPSNGEGEQVSLQDETGEKRDMKDLYGKALTRKAEALEQMEKWADAGVVWQSCVESGVGGPTAIAGRQRCQKALTPKPTSKPASKPATPRPRPRPTPKTAASGDSEAVSRLQAANKAADAADAEKFALSDQVDARIAGWRDGKRENLRALLASLDQVLWDGSGWKKVGLHELVMANRVKIVYMKAIAKTHPDKLPQDANTEVRMIAGTVFSTLNESWDKFKAENGL